LEEFMADYDGLTPGQILADASVAEFIKTLGLGIAEAQRALDENSVQHIAEFIAPREGLGGKTLLDLGLSPAFYHYQYADVSCSLQLSLRVQKDSSLGLSINGSYNSGNTSSSNSSNTSSSSASGSSTRSETRQANVQITSSSNGALVVGGQNFALSGASPQERIRNLQTALTGDSNAGVERVLYQLEGSDLTITTDADASKVQTTKHTVAFLGGGYDRGVVRVGVNAATTYNLDNAPPTSASTTPQADLSAYAIHVSESIKTKGYKTLHLAPPNGATERGVVESLFFDTGSHEVSPDGYKSLRYLAQLIQQRNIPVEVEGFADRQMYSTDSQKSDALNRQLGDNRANEVKKILLANGAPTNLVTVKPSSGDKAAENAHDERGKDNQGFRKADITTPGRKEHWVLVHAQEGGPNLNGVEPDMRADNSSANGFIFLYKPSPLDLEENHKTVTIEGTVFPFRGAAAGTFAASTPEAYALNLATDINANQAAQLQASASANVVTVSRNGDPFKLILVTSSNRNITLSGTSGITVSEQFSRSQTSSLTQQNTGNRAVAFGASLDVRSSRQFEMNVTGNSAISARLVSIPAPPQFLETIREFLKDAGES
jgi:outer membrane protein OmpA-like peptidoglycan-associated protein